MNSIFKQIIRFLKKWFESKAAKVNHISIIKDINQEVEISGSYFVILTLANLIALSGLIQNSIPVIIGAMLISPLMGPILSFGFAFITGDKAIWWKSLRKLAMSVIITIVIAAVATFFSPLKGITNEIIIRTKPNLYDLLIAFFSGFAGAAALCTKKNYLTIVPGVAIATAVIPPLSVTGFGLGIANINILLGSFLLFFTNFVAIVISTCIVFYIYGFKPSIITEEDVSALKKRVSVLAIVLFIISIPLIYTLHQSISEVRFRANIQSALKREIEKPGTSRLSAFSYMKKNNDKLEINATINTVAYIKEADLNNIEKKIKDSIRYDMKLHVEQVKVQAGGLKETPFIPAILPPKPPQDIIKSSRESVIDLVRQSVEKIENIILPSTVAEFYVGFHDKTPDVSIALKIKKDTPLSDDEMLWLKRIFAIDLNSPVDISVETIPFVPLLVFNKGETDISVAMKSSLAAIKNAYMRESKISVLAEAYPESSVAYNKRIKLARQRLNALSTVLTKEYGIPESSITTIIGKKTVQEPSVKIMVGVPQSKP